MFKECSVAFHAPVRNQWSVQKVALITKFLHVVFGVAIDRSIEERKLFDFDFVLTMALSVDFRAIALDVVGRSLLSLLDDVMPNRFAQR